MTVLIYILLCYTMQPQAEMRVSNKKADFLSYDNVLIIYCFGVVVSEFFPENTVWFRLVQPDVDVSVTHPLILTLETQFAV